MILPHIIYWLGAISDNVTTNNALKLSGVKEANPIARFAYQKWGGTGLWVLKALIWGVFLWLGMPAGVYYIAGGVFFAAGIWNYRILRKRK